MSTKRVLITGGTGFIGTALAGSLQQDDHEVLVLSRNPQRVRIGRAVADLAELSTEQPVDVVVNLAGAPIDRRWSAACKQELLDSRIETTRKLVQWMGGLSQRPQTLISGSAIGWYGAQGDTPLDEGSAPEDEFTHRLCRDWEAAAARATELGVRTCCIRLGVVLERDGGALRKMLPAFWLGLGGPIGNGAQMFSWVHRADVVAAIRFLIDEPGCSGAYNLTAPEPVSNRAWSRALGAALHRPAFLPMPAFVVRLLFGEMGDRLLLHGQRVLPSRLQQAGFEFQYPDLRRALSAIFN